MKGEILTSWPMFYGPLERADKVSRILDMKYYILLRSPEDVGTSFDHIQWGAVLRSASAFEMYCKRHGRISPSRVVDFLLFDNEFPRSVRYAAGHASGCLHAITGTPAGAFSCASEQRLGVLKSELDFGRVDVILAEGLHEFLDGLQARLNRIDEGVAGDFFGRRPAVQAMAV